MRLLISAAAILCLAATALADPPAKRADCGCAYSDAQLSAFPPNCTCQLCTCGSGPEVPIRFYQTGVGFRSRTRTVTTATACGPAPAMVYHLPTAPTPVPPATTAAPKLTVTVGGCANGQCAPATSSRTVIRIRQR